MAKYMSVTQIISVSIFLKDQVVVRMDSVSRDPVLVVPVLATPVVITQGTLISLYMSWLE